MNINININTCNTETPYATLLQKSPVLKSPDYKKPLKLIIDSSDVATGAVLVQEASGGLDHPVSYFSKKFLKYQRNYLVV